MMEKIFITKKFWEKCIHRYIPLTYNEDVEKLFFVDRRELAFIAADVYLYNTIAFSFSNGLNAQETEGETKIVNSLVFKSTFNDEKVHEIAINFLPLPSHSFFIDSFGDSYFQDKDMESIAFSLMAVFYGIQLSALRKKRTIDKIRNHIQKRRAQKEKSEKRQEYKVYLNKDVIYRYEPSERHRDFVRHCEAWSVRGHYRNYKNGKTIFIQPYVKGKGRLNSKVYIEGT